MNKEKAIKYIDENAGIFTGVSDKIWDKPELSLKEFYASRLYCELLREEGFSVKEGICGIETAFSASFGSGKPVIGILGEYDALSGLKQKAGSTEYISDEPGAPGHGCGHNLLGAGSLAAAFAVKHYLEMSGASGTVVFYGCPGEEGGAGKAFMAREGLWKELDAALCWHPNDVNEVISGTNNSCIQVLYKFSGLSAHAAGDPHNGRSALDAVELMNIGVQFLREHITPDCRIHYAITDAGGVSPNVVQAKASVLYMVRANKVADSIKLQRRVDNIAKAAALMTDTTYERVFIDGTAELLPNYALEELLYENLCAIGTPEYTEEEISFANTLRNSYTVDKAPGFACLHDSAIADQLKSETNNFADGLHRGIIPLYHSAAFIPGSTDVGDVSWLTPTAQVHTVCFSLGAPGHSWQNVSCGRTSIAHKGMLLAGKVLAATVIDLMEQPEKLASARAELAKKSESGYVCPIEENAVPIAL